MTEAESFSTAGLVAPHPLAAMAARDVMIEGGTIVEAALAAAMTAAVVVPQRNGLGGDALWLLREAGPNGRVRVLDARGIAGAAARADRLRDLGHDDVPRHGAAAVLGTPGAVAGWAEAHALSTALGGRLPLDRLLAPAIAAARDGVELSPGDALARAEAVPLADLPGFAATFLADGGKPPPAGARWHAPVLAETLEYLARAGLHDLVRGDVGRELTVDLEELGCAITRDDLRRGEVRWREPATLDLGRRSITIAPHAAAVAAAVALGLLAGIGPVRPDSFDAWHGLIGSLALAPATLEAATRQEGGFAALLDRDALKRAAERIDRRRAAPPASLAPIFPEDAIFVGAVDREGAAVAVVQTLGGTWGSGVVSGRTGILLANRAAAFSLDPAKGSTLAPGRRAPLRSTAMLLSGRDGRVVSLGATGSHGGSLVAQVAARLLLADASPEAATGAPRILLGATPDGEPAILVEAEHEPEPARQLRAAGHSLRPVTSAESRTLGLVARLASGRIEAASDAGDDAAAGL